MHEPPAAEARGVTKRFGARAALRGVDMALQRGERVALFGPNGSGKTTLLRIMAGLTQPTRGEVRIAGMDFRRGGQALRLRVGVIGHHPYLYDDLTAEENLAFYARMFGVSDPHGRALALLEAVGMAQRRRDKVRGLSRGMQQRVALARAMLHDPEVLLLDEPDAGLDQEAAGRLGEYFVRTSGESRAVIMATHDLRLGLRLCQRYVMLLGGRVAASGNMAGLDADGLEQAYAAATSRAGQQGQAGQQGRPAQRGQA